MQLRQTFGVSAIAVITSEVKSRGCGEVNRSRSRPSISPQERSSAANAPRSPNSTPYALTFWPSSVTSSTPSAASAATSASSMALPSANPSIVSVAPREP